MQNFQTFINILSKGKKIHICVLDMSGVLSTDYTAVSQKNAIHTKAFCDVAKSTVKGRRLCLKCKTLANNKSVKEKKPFSGYCPWGLYEVAYPVVKGGDVLAVVYVGNIVTDEKKTKEKIKKACALTEVSEKEIMAHLDECDRATTVGEAFQVAEIVGDYLIMLSENVRNPRGGRHWLVGVLKNYADTVAPGEISINSLSGIYHKNEKYMGRLFKKEMGKSYAEYCNDIRIERALELLKNTDAKIIDIALECGFNHVSYFNRVFKKKYGVSPTEYRKMVTHFTTTHFSMP